MALILALVSTAWQPSSVGRMVPSVARPVMMCSTDAKIRQLRELLQDLRASGTPEEQLQPLQDELQSFERELVERMLPSPPPPSLPPPSPKLRQLDETLFGLSSDGIPAEQLLPLKQQIEELRALEGAAPAEPPSLTPPPPAPPDPSTAMRDAMSSVFGMFGVSARDLTAEELAALEQREAAAREAREVEAAAVAAQRLVADAVDLARRGLDALSEATGRAKAVLEQSQRDGAEVLLYLGEARRDEKRTRLASTAASLEEALEAARASLASAADVCVTANDEVANQPNEARAEEVRTCCRVCLVLLPCIRCRRVCCVQLASTLCHVCTRR